MEALLRRHQDTLIIVGRGNLLFGVWGMIRTVMTFILHNPERDKIIAEFQNTPDYDSAWKPLYYGVFLLFLLLVLAAEMGLRLYICRSAKAEGMGGRKSLWYVILAGFMSVASIVVLGYNLYSGYYQDLDLFDTVITVVIELTSAVMLLELVAASIRVRQLRRKLVEGG